MQKPVKNSAFQLKDHAFLQASNSTAAIFCAMVAVNTLAGLL